MDPYEAISAATTRPGSAAGVFHHTSIGQRLAIAFFLFILLMMAMAGIGAWQLAELNRVAASNMRVERIMGEWLGETRANSVRAIVMAETDDPALKHLIEPEMEAASARISELQKQVEPLVTTPRARALFGEVGVKRSNYLKLRKTILEKRHTGQAEEALALLEQSLLPAVNTYVASIKNLVDFYASEAETDAATARATAVTGRNVLIGVCAVGILFGVLFSWLITASITRPIGSAVAVAKRVAQGDLTAQVRTGSRSETGQLLSALSEMTQNLRTLVGEVAGGAHTVSDSSARIAQGNLDLSQRSEEQASTLEETASSMEELTARVAQNAESARQASQLALGASNVARKGGDVVDQVVSTMDDISDASRKIADIIGVIDGIAFQTNILALNAAVEAARAGEQGRGFAVVASEVRSLAQRSAAAAKEIKTLIGDSADKVRAGASLADAAGHTMVEIVSSVQKVSDLIAQIAAASQEQGAGIEQVNTAITQMDRMVQQNASLVEEGTAATESMKDQAGSLLRTVSRFRLDTAQAAPRPA